MAKKKTQKVDKEVKKQPEHEDVAPVIQRELLESTAIKKQLNVFPYAQNLKLGDDAEIVVKEIEKWIEQVEIKRTEFSLEDIWQDGREQYEGIHEDKDFPWPDSSNLHIHVTSMSADVLNTKAAVQMYPKPMMLYQPLPGQIGDKLYEDMQAKENFSDYKARVEMNIERATKNVRLDAINLGTGIAKLTYERLIDNNVTTFEIYNPTDKDKARFEEDFKDQKGTPSYRQYMKDLKDGMPAQVWIVQDEVVYDNPKISYVALDDLYVMPDIPNIRNQRIIAEKMKYTWPQLMDLVRTGKFDEDNVMELKDKFEADYYKRTYDVIQGICYHKMDNSDEMYRIVVTYLYDTKHVVKSITYPYMHRQSFYIFYRIDPRDDSIYGRGLAWKLKDTNKAINQLWNQTIDSGTLRNAPAFLAKKGSSFDPSIKDWGPATIWWVDNISTDVKNMEVGGHGVEMLNYISRLERYAEWLTGVTAYMTGRESPSDPKAPMGKAYMLLKESNLRVNEAIKSLHNSNQILFEQMDSLVYQFARGFKLPYQITNGEKIEQKSIDRKLLGMKANRIPHLSDISVNKELEKQQSQKFSQYLMQFPEIAGNPQARRTILDITISQYGGQWEKKKDELLPEAKKKPVPGSDQTSMLDKINKPPESKGGLPPVVVPGAGVGTPKNTGAPKEDIPV